MNGFGPVITAMVTPFDEYNQLNEEFINKYKPIVSRLFY